MRATDRDTIKQDKATLIKIVKEMSESMTGAQSTKHWAEDALWFDIPPFASRGLQPAVAMFDKVFGGFRSCDVDILATDVVQGIVHLADLPRTAYGKVVKGELKELFLSRRGQPA